jgi:predicted dehydrogenase
VTDRALRIGVVGMTSDHVWGMGQNLATLPGVAMVCGAEPYAELREQAQSRFGLQRTYADYREMFAKEQLDAILACGDNAGKVAVVEEAAKYKVHVYLDKALAATLAQADRIIAVAERAGIQVMVAYHNYFGAAYTRGKEIVRAGRIGNVYLARGIVGHSGPQEVGCSKYFCEWLFDKEKGGGGAFVDEACYTISAFLDYMGPIVEVSSFMAGMGWRDYLPAGIEENTVTIVRFQSGALGIIDAKWGQIGMMPFMQSFHGVKGTVLAGWDSLQVYAPQALPADMQGWVQMPFRESGQRYGSEGQAFVNGIRQNKPFEGPISLRGARATQEVIEAAYRSAQTGQVVRLPLP